MNWELFSAALSIGLVAALVSMNRSLSPLEAWALVASRVAAAAVLALLMPEEFTGACVAALGVWEGARATALLIAFVIYRGRVRREAEAWLARYRQAATQRET